MREKVKEKQKAYAALSSCTSEGKKKGVWEAMYKAAKKLAKKAVAIAKNNAYERLYQKLDTKERENDVFELARVREKKRRNLGCVRCTKGEDGKVIAEETKIRERWRSYFSRLFNSESEYSLRLERGVQERHLNDRECCHISKEVKGALRKMKSGKVVGPYLIPRKIGSV